MNDVSRDEFKVLRAILTNEFHSEPGEARIGSAIFCRSLDAATEPCGFDDGEHLADVLASLARKKLVVTDGTTVALTADGYAAATDAM
ncbi:MAG TPA: hypothetical protein VL492_00145 [Methylovirgula sp.]|jgi:hypothetical protein|nr:hypothetical protein [Methylovirgula sp.]